MESALRELVDHDGHLIKLLTPPFNKTEKNPGYIKGYPPGVRENGGQYTHAAAWLIIASALQGAGDTAFNLLDLINPINATLDAKGLETYRAEPYVMCGDVYSEPPLRGRAGWSWYTGSSGWLYQAGIENIMGLKVHPLHITINPCVPSSWDHSVVRYRRGERLFVFELINPSGAQQGVSRIEVNGTEIPDKKIQLEDPSYRGTVNVKVFIGRD
jgi:cyclic beta-1,2-glucan synthetase